VVAQIQAGDRHSGTPIQGELIMPIGTIKIILGITQSWRGGAYTAGKGVIKPINAWANNSPWRVM
jgi:hypothetical protein